jgi:hypothetical protein
MSNKIIFGSGTSRTGASLLTSMLSVHKDILITTDFLHFFRFIYDKYSPINLASNQYKLAHEMCLRIKYRQQIDLSPKELMSYFKEVKNYNGIILAISNFILDKNKSKKIIGEFANTEWRNIETFLGFDDNYKAFQIIRDPRAVLSAFKKITYSKGFKYLNLIFQWIDAVNYSEIYLKKYNHDRYLRIKYEDIVSYPEKSVDLLCKFLEVKVDPNMLRGEKWKGLLDSKFNFINVSAYTNKKSYGFSKYRIFKWKDYLEDWEVALVQYLLKDYLNKLDYEVFDCDPNLVKKGLDIIEGDEILSQNFYHYQKTHQGTNKLLNDPSKPENWAATKVHGEQSKNITDKFVDTNDYKNYLKEFNKIQKNSEML